MTYFQAEQHRRTNSIEGGFNLWGRIGEVWINYATYAVRDDRAIERSKGLHGPCEEWKIVQGSLNP